MVEHKKIVGALGLLLLIVLGMFIFAGLKSREISEQGEVPQDTEAPESPYAGITRIDAKHFYNVGEHTVVGEIPMPTPCDLLNWTTRVAESDPEIVTLDFDVINTAETCATVVTPQRFKVMFTASEYAEIRATLEGRSIEVNLIPGAPGESPDDFEIFIKG